MFNDEKTYTTRESAKLIGISFRTIQRWIYSVKIYAQKTSSGRYRIQESEIDRLKGVASKELEELNKIRTEVLKLLNKKKIAYLRELQVCMEYSHLHENTYETLNVMVENGSIKSQSYDGNRWYFEGKYKWEDVESLAIQKKELLDYYVDYPCGFKMGDTIYDDYSEFLVERALIHAGFIVSSKNAYYFNGNSYRQNIGAGRPKDVDFIVHERTKEKYLGIQIKNRLEYPKVDDIHEFLDICNTLNLIPVLVTRISHPRIYSLINNVNGKIVIFLRYFKKPEFPKEKFDAITIDLGIPLGVYRRVPDFLVQKFENLKSEL